jgi:uncharacterized protein (UPF0147 family)
MKTAEELEKENEHLKIILREVLRITENIIKSTNYPLHGTTDNILQHAKELL